MIPIINTHFMANGGNPVVALGYLIGFGIGVVGLLAWGLYRLAKKWKRA